MPIGPPVFQIPQHKRKIRSGYLRKGGAIDLPTLRLNRIAGNDRQLPANGSLHLQYSPPSFHAMRHREFRAYLHGRDPAQPRQYLPVRPVGKARRFDAAEPRPLTKLRTFQLSYSIRFRQNRGHLARPAQAKRGFAPLRNPGAQLWRPCQFLPTVNVGAWTIGQQAGQRHPFSVFLADPIQFACCASHDIQNNFPCPPVCSSTHNGPSYFGLLTTGLTGKVLRSSPVYVFSNCDNSAGSFRCESSQAS